MVAATVAESHDERFALLFGERRGHLPVSSRRRVSAAEAQQALCRFGRVTALRDAVQVWGLEAAVQRAIHQLACGADPRAEERPLTITKYENGRACGSYASTVEELVADRGLLGLNHALKFCVADSTITALVFDHDRFDLAGSDPEVVALQVAWLICNDWEWLVDLGVKSVPRRS